MSWILQFRRALYGEKAAAERCNTTVLNRKLSSGRTATSYKGASCLPLAAFVSKKPHFRPSPVPEWAARQSTSPSASESHAETESRSHGGLELGWTNTPAPSESVGPDPAAAAAARATVTAAPGPRAGPGSTTRPRPARPFPGLFLEPGGSELVRFGARAQKPGLAANSVEPRPG